MMIRCSICGSDFIPDSTERSASRMGAVVVCSAGCMDAWVDSGRVKAGWLRSSMEVPCTSWDNRCVSAPCAVYSEVTGSCYRSPLERTFAEYYHDRYPLLYEPVTLVLNNRVYTPDFVFADRVGRVVEVKGRSWGPNRSKHKFYSFVTGLQGLEFLLITGRVLSTIGDA